VTCLAGEGRDFIGAFGCKVEIPAFAGMTIQIGVITP